MTGVRGARLTVAGAILGVVGTALLIYEGIRAISLNHVLGFAGQLLIWVGLGVMAVGGVLLIAGAWSDPNDVTTAGPAPDES